MERAGKILAVILVVAGIAAIVAYNLMERRRDIDRANGRQLAEQQIANGRFNPLTFQNYCGIAPSKTREGRIFMLSYPAGNVAVSFLSDSGDSENFKQVHYLSIRPPAPITLSEVVARLDCSPRP